jgi:hypothetical protein
MDTGVIDGQLTDREQDSAEPVQVDLPEVRHDLAGFGTVMRHLVKSVGGSGLAQLGGAAELVEFMQTYEHYRNLMPLVDHALIAEAKRLDLPTQLCQGNMARVLTSALSLSRPEAARRVRAAEAVGPRVSMLGNRWHRSARIWRRRSARVR